MSTSTDNKTRPSVRRGALSKAQIDIPSYPNTPARLPHLSTSKLSDEMAQHLIGALVMRSLIQPRKGDCHGA